MASPVQPVANPGTSYPPTAIPPAPGAAPAAQPAPTPTPAPPAPVANPQVLNGPTVPQELRGRTLDDALRIYTALRDTHPTVRSNAPASTAAPAPAAPKEEAAATPGSFWANPESAIDAAIDRRMRTVMSEMLGPTIANTNFTAAKSARDAVAAQFTDFVQHEASVLQKLQGLPPQAMANPQAWQNAYYMARGEAAATGTVITPAAPVAPTENFAPTFRPAPSSAHFVESARGSGDFASGTLTADEISIAGKMGMSGEQYLSWKGGVRK